jgi:hypothetical protein
VSYVIGDKQVSSGVSGNLSRKQTSLECRPTIAAVQHIAISGNSCDNAALIDFSDAPIHPIRNVQIA